MPLLGTRPTSQTAPSGGRGAVMSTLIGIGAGLNFPLLAEFPTILSFLGKWPSFYILYLCEGLQLQVVGCRFSSSIHLFNHFANEWMAAIWRQIKCPLKAFYKRTRGFITLGPIWPFSWSRVHETLTVPYSYRDSLGQLLICSRPRQNKKK